MKRRTHAISKHRLLHPVTLDPDGNVPAAEADRLRDGAAPGHWFVITTRDIELHPNFSGILARLALSRPDVGIFYADDVAPGEDTGPWDLSLKPNWDQTLFLANDYVGLPLFIRASDAKSIGTLDAARGSAAAYDLLLRAHAAGVVINRIPEVLGRHDVRRFCADVEDRRMALEAWASARALPMDVRPGMSAGSLRVDTQLAQPPQVTVVVAPSQDCRAGSDARGIESLLAGIAGSTYPMAALHVLVDSDTAKEEIDAHHRWPFHLRRIETASAPGSPPSRAARLNRLWREAPSEHVILVDNDIGILSPDWIQALLSFSTQRDVGCVGARLLSPEGTIVHAGIAGGDMTRLWLGQGRSEPTYQDWALVHREWSMVSSAVLAARKSILEEVNGFDEEIATPFIDLDLCLKLRMLGQRVVYTPHAQFTVAEPAHGRGNTWLASELAIFLRRWGRFLPVDPSFHPKLDAGSGHVQPMSVQGEWWQRQAAWRED